MSTPVIVQATARHTATVIFMHGLGDTGHGWASAFQQIRSPHIKYICPTAPSTPVSLNMGFVMPSWFDIKSLAIDGEEDESGIKAAAKSVHGWIEAQEKAGIPSNRIVLGGFSQGGALALYSAITYDRPLAGVLALSSWLPLHKQLPGNHSANRSVPILQCHGSADSLVTLEVGQRTAQLLETFNTKHSMKVYQGMAHSSCDEEMVDVKKFIADSLPPQ